MKKGWMRVQEFSEYVGVGKRTVFRWLDMGLPSVKVGNEQRCTRLIHVGEADEWLKQFRSGNKSPDAAAIADQIMGEIQCSN